MAWNIVYKTAGATPANPLVGGLALTGFAPSISVTTQAAIRQVIFDNFPGQPGDNQNLDRSVTLSLNVLAGSTLIVFGTQENLGTAIAVPTLSDTLNGAGYTLKEKTDDVDSPDGLLSGYTWYLPDSVGGAYTLNVHFQNLEWQGICAIEVTGVPAASYIGSSSAQSNGFTSTTTDALSTGTIVGGSQKAILIAMGQSIADFGTAQGGSGLGRPNAGTGFSHIVSAGDNGIWPLNGREGTSLASSTMIESQNFTSMGTVAATFTGTGGRADDLNLHAIALKSN